MMNKINKQDIIILAIALFIALLPRLYIYNQYGAGISNDSFEYLSIGHNISQTNNFSVSIQLHKLKDNNSLRDSILQEKRFPDNITKGYPPRTTMFRTPGYPGFVGITFKIFGENYNFIIFIQIFLQLLSIVCLYLGLKNLLFEQGVNLSNKVRYLIILIITLFFSLHPGIIVTSRNILRESFELFLLTVTIYFYTLNDKRIGKILLGITLGVLVLTLQSFIYLFYIIPFFLLINLFIRKKQNTLFDITIPISIIVPLIIAFLLIQGWCFRNYQQENHYTLSSFQPGAATLGIMLGSETKNNGKPDVSLTEIVSNYNPDNSTKNFLLKAECEMPDADGQLAFKRKVYVTSDDSLIKLDDGFKSLAFKIVVKNPKIIIKNLIRSTYGTYRSDFYYSNLENNSTGNIRYPLSFSKIQRGGLTVFDIWAVLMWIFFLGAMGYFILSKAPLFFKILFLIYILPYSFSPSVEERVTVIFNLFLIIGVVYFLTHRPRNLNK